jgi:16S rRNA G966 N2-methylase RsmD
MKIISGYRGGQFIKVPKTIKVRPTTGKSKEGIFNILNNNFHLLKNIITTFIIRVKQYINFFNEFLRKILQPQ